MIKKLISTLILSTLLTSCGEEILTQNTVSETFGAPDLVTFNRDKCAGSTLVKPPVDILFVVDNSGSTLENNFEALKEQIAKTVLTISNDFDYHVYIAPLKAKQGDNISNYPLIVSNPDTLSGPLSNFNLVSLENINSSIFFATAHGGKTEEGFDRVYDLINSNKSNKIFRSRANLVTVMISNFDDTSTLISNDGMVVGYDHAKFTNKKNRFINLKSSLNAKSFRFISLAPHDRCKGWNYHGGDSRYAKMSKDLYQAFGLTDDSVYNHARDLCSGEYSTLFQTVNSSIQKELVGYKYDHWLISSASASSIQEDDIKVFRVKESGQKEEIPQSSSNGFEYLGYKQSVFTRYAPDAGEPVTGLVVKLNGNARISYPDCVIAKTRTPTEYFGYVVLPREPQLGTIKIEINGKKINSDNTNGWTYVGYQPSKNIKVPGPTDAPVTPEVLKSGYFIKLNGTSIIQSGDDINIYYKPMAI